VVVIITMRNWRGQFRLSN